MRPPVDFKMLIDTEIVDVRGNKLDRRRIVIELRAGLGHRHCRDEKDEERKCDCSGDIHGQENALIAVLYP